MLNLKVAKSTKAKKIKIVYNINEKFTSANSNIVDYDENGAPNYVNEGKWDRKEKNKKQSSNDSQYCNPDQKIIQIKQLVEAGIMPKNAKILELFAGVPGEEHLTPFYLGLDNIKSVTSISRAGLNSKTGIVHKRSRKQIGKHLKIVGDTYRDLYGLIGKNYKCNYADIDGYCFPNHVWENVFLTFPTAQGSEVILVVTSPMCPPRDNVYHCENLLRWSRGESSTYLSEVDLAALVGDMGAKHMYGVEPLTKYTRIMGKGKSRVWRLVFRCVRVNKATRGMIKTSKNKKS